TGIPEKPLPCRTGSSCERLLLGTAAHRGGGATTGDKCADPPTRRSLSLAGQGATGWGIGAFVASCRKCADPPTRRSLSLAGRRRTSDSAGTSGGSDPLGWPERDGARKVLAEAARPVAGCGRLAKPERSAKKKEHVDGRPSEIIMVRNGYGDRV